jgi:hypothetical protein
VEAENKTLCALRPYRPVHHQEKLAQAERERERSIRAWNIRRLRWGINGSVVFHLRKGVRIDGACVCTSDMAPLRYGLRHRIIPPIRRVCENVVRVQGVQVGIRGRHVDADEIHPLPEE